MPGRHVAFAKAFTIVCKLTLFLQSVIMPYTGQFDPDGDVFVDYAQGDKLCDPDDDDGELRATEADVLADFFDFDLPPDLQPDETGLPGATMGLLFEDPNWKKRPRNMESQQPAFSPSEPVGNKIPVADMSEQEIFDFFLQDGIPVVLRNTNKHAETDPTHWTGEWERLEKPELMRWIALLLMMGTGQKARMRDHWRNSPLFRNDLFQGAMTRKRWLQIYHFLRFYDPEYMAMTGKSDKDSIFYDNLHKVNEFMELVFKVNYDVYVAHRICVNKTISALPSCQKTRPKHRSRRADGPVLGTVDAQRPHAFQARCPT